MLRIVQQTRGGQYTAYMASGNLGSGGINVAFTNPLGAKQAGLDVMLCSGQGRLNSIIVHTINIGTSVPIYDAADVASGGPFLTSGARVLAFVPGFNGGVVSGGITGPIVVDAPFSSGLCIGCKSGVNLFSVTYSQEINPQLPTPNG